MTSLSTDFFELHQPDVDLLHRNLAVDMGKTQDYIDSLK